MAFILIVWSIIHFSNKDQPKNYDNFLKKWHFSQTEKYQLLSLLVKLDLRFPDNNFIEITENLKTGKLVLKKLQDKLNKTDFHISGLGKLIDIDATTVNFLPRIAYSYAPGISSLFNYEDYSLDVVSFLKTFS